MLQRYDGHIVGDVFRRELQVALNKSFHRNFLFFLCNTLLKTSTEAHRGGKIEEVRVPAEL